MVRTEVRIRISSPDPIVGLYGLENCSVAEPESVEPKLFCGTGAVTSYFGSGSTAPEPKYLIF